MRMLLSFLLLCCALLVPAPVAAQSGPAARPSPAALAANTQGAAAFAAGDFAGAITAFHRAVQLDPAARTFVTNLATAYQKADRWPEAQALLEAKIKTFPAPDDKKELAVALADNHFFWAQKLNQSNQYQAVLAHLQKALAIDRLYRPTDLITDLYALGSVSDSLTRYDQAVGYYQEGLPLVREAGDRSSEANFLNNLGTLCDTLGQFEKAIDLEQQALGIERELQDRQREAATLDNLGLACDHLGQHDRAVEFYQQSLSLRRELADRKGEATTLNNFGSSYNEMGKHDKALEFLQQALSLCIEIGDSETEAATLNSMGVAYDSLQQYEKAVGLYEQALPLQRGVQDREGEAVTLSNLMGSWESLNAPDLAIWYGKQGVAIFQEIRGSLRAQDAETQQSYLATHEANYRLLADLLIHQGRLSEALQVLQMLKQQEFFDFLGRDPKAGLAPQSSVRRTPREAEWGRLYAQIPRDKPVAPFLVRLTAAFHTPAGTPAGAAIPAASEAGDLSDTLGRMKPGTVVIYTIVEPDQIRLIVVTSDTQRAASFPIKAADLYQKVLAFRNALQDPTRDPRALAQELYKMLVGPIKPDLEKAHATTLLWSLDDALRYLPISALYGGDHYLVERYDNCVLTLAGPAQITQTPRTASWTALGLGVSQEHPGFDALPGVRAELAGIIGPVVPGISLLDSQFTQASFLAGLKRRNHPLVHIASHFSLSGRDTDSFLLLGDGGHLSLARIKADPNIFAGVDLLTLSACNTAMEVRSAGGREVEGFGALAQRLGARSVLASLWPVADASTPVLMREFYRLRRTHPALSKAAGLRQAQTELLRGQAAAVSLPQATGSRAYRAKIAGAANTSLPLFVADPKAPYAHPYYWAPFVLIGNPQ